MVTYEITKRISLLSGINYSIKGYQWDWSVLRFGKMFDPRFRLHYETFENHTSSGSSTSNYTYIDIPFKFLYSFSANKIRLGTEVGFIANIFLDSYTNSFGIKNDRYGDFYKIGISASLGLGAIYDLNSRFRITCMHGFQYSLTNLETSPINEHLYNAGINVGWFTYFDRS